ncbi:MAG: cell division protein FtsQ/DivIB [Bacteroidales bacterium]
MKKVIRITAWITVIAVLGVLVGFINREQKNRDCKAIEVTFESSDDPQFLDEQNIIDLLIQKYDSIEGRKLSEIDLETIERDLNDHPLIAGADVYTTLKGELKINLVQKKPLLRIIPQKGKSWYLDREGTSVPPVAGKPVRTLVASGYIETPYIDTLRLKNNDNFPVINDLYKLALYINQNRFLKAQIEQIYVNDKGEYELVPKVGRQIIIFGDLNDMEAKFDKLIAFYEKGIGKSGWSAYKTINLKYRDQIVCARR